MQPAWRMEVELAQTRLVDPIFLMCSERSGSNLITKMFDAHPKIAAPGTSHLFRVFADIEPSYGDDLETLRCDIRAMFEAKVSAWLTDGMTAEDRKRLLQSDTSAGGMIAAIMNAEAAYCGKTRIFVKENSIYKFIPFLESISDNPSYAFMVRDPRDMALSWQSAPVLRGGILRAAKRWMADQEGFLAAASLLRKTRPVAFLTYEKLVSEPEATLRSVCGNLGITFSESMVEFHLRSRSAQVDAARADVWGNLARPTLTTNFNKFAGALDDDQLAYIEMLCGPLMAEFGYEKTRASGSPPFGSCADLGTLEAVLKEREPWDKRAYLDLPHEERKRFEHWSAVHARVSARTRSQSQQGREP